MAYHISANSFLPWIVSPHFSIYEVKNCHNTETIWKFPHFPLSKKNSFRGNCLWKYGRCDMSKRKQLCFNQKLLCPANERRDEGKSQVYSTESLNLPKYIFSHWLRRFVLDRTLSCSYSLSTSRKKVCFNSHTVFPQIVTSLE